MDVTYIWVDEIEYGGYWGNTTDIKKVYRNFTILGEFGIELEQSINVKLLTVDYNAEIVTSLGRFICMIEIKKDENTGNMHFFDFRLKKEHEWEFMFKQSYGSELGLSFMKAYREAQSSFLSSTDNFELSLSL